MTKEEIKASPVGLRFNEGKLRWGLMHYGAMEPMIRVLMYGSEKYTDWNWVKGLDKREILECAQRHLAALMDGNEFDYDENCDECKTGFCKKHSGLHHIGHLMANCMFYSYFATVKKEEK